jgi:hypothetical protein
MNSGSMLQALAAMSGRFSSQPPLLPDILLMVLGTYFYVKRKHLWFAI